MIAGNTYFKLRCLTGKDQSAINEFGYELAIIFINSIEKDKEMIAHIERSKPFWNWWRRQLVQLSGEFLNIEGIEWTKYRKESVWESYKSFCRMMKVSSHGLKSFEYLAAEMLQPEYKKGKEKVINH